MIAIDCKIANFSLLMLNYQTVEAYVDCLLNKHTYINTAYSITVECEIHSHSL